MTATIKSIFTTSVFLLVATHLQAQVGIGTNNPHTSAQLEVRSNNKGVLLPSISLTGTNDVSTISSPATGLLIYNSNTVSGPNAVTPGFYYFNGTAWVRLIVPTDNAANVTGTIAVANGGTGATSAAGAITNLGVIASAEKGANNGVATLGSDGKIPSAQIPAVSFQSANVVASEAAMLALSSAVVGSIAIRTDLSKNFVLRATPASALANWIELATPTSVTSVNGNSGPSVTLTPNSLGASTIGNNLFTLANPGAVSFPQFNANNTVSALSASDFRAAIGAGTSSTSGTVSSVGLSLPSILSVSGSPVTSSGTLSASLANQNANLVFAGPASGSAAAPTFRTLVAADIPTLNQNTTGTASNVTGTVAVANGGTGTTTGSITGTGALTFTAGGTNQGITLSPTGTGSIILNSNVGIGTTSPTSRLNLVGGGIKIHNGFSNNTARPSLTGATIGNYEIRGVGSITGNSQADGGDDGFLRLSAGGGTNASAQSSIDLSGFSLDGDMTNSIVMRTAGTERLRINASGNVILTGNLNVRSTRFETVGGDEGGEIEFGVPQTNTTLSTRVVADIFQDRLRFFDGNTKGVYIDLSKAPTGVAGELTWKASGIVNAGTFVQLDNLKVTCTASGNRGLSIGAVSTTFTASIGGTFGGAGGSGGTSAFNVTYTTAASSSTFNWHFAGAGDISTYIITDTTNNRAYRVTLQIGFGYNNNLISIERLH
jgi:hypothetical protein